MSGRDPLRRLLQSALDAWFADAPEARARCATLDGRSVVVELDDLGFTFTLHPGETGLRVEPGAGEDADARLRAGTFDLFRLARSGGAKGAPGRIHIEGDAELAEEMRDLLRSVPFDPEERLARVIGDVPAHEAFRALRGLLDIGRRTAGEAGVMIAEYLKFESRDLPARHEVEDFIHQVDEVHDAVERAAARLAGLGGRGAAPSHRGTSR